MWPLLALWLAASLIMGYQAARLALPKESRRFVLLSYGLVGGYCAQAILLVLVWSAVPLGQAFPLVVGLSLAVAGLLQWRRSGRKRSLPLAWGMTPAQTALILALCAAFVFLGQRVFTAGYSAWDAEALYLHSGIVSWLGHGTYPPTNPLEPDDPLRYRFGLHVVAAAISAAGNGLPTETLAAVAGALLGMMLIAFVGASLRAFGSARPGIAAGLLGVFGGSLLPLLRAAQIGFLGMPVDGRERELINGLLLTGNTLDLVHKNVSVAAGFVVFAIALWLSWEAVGHEPVNLAACGVAVVALANLGLVNEVHFAVLAVAVAGVGALRSLSPGRSARSRWLRAAVPIIVVALASAFALLKGGFLGGMAFSQGSSDSVQLALNLEHFGQVVSPPNAPGPQWIPLLSPAAQLDTALIVIGLPVLLWFAWCTRDSFAGIGLAAAAAAFVLWISVYPRTSPWDAYRFGQAAVTIYIAMAPFAVQSARHIWSQRHDRLLWWTQACALAALVVPHAIFAASVTVSPPPAVWAIPGSPDVLAAEYLRQSTDTQRVLVPLDRMDDDWTRLYSPDGPPAAMRVILGLSGHAIPMGFVHYFNPEAYLPEYRVASSTFDRSALAALRIDWVYVLPAYLSPDQRRYLQAAKRRGELEPMRSFGETGTSSERILYNVIR